MARLGRRSGQGAGNMRSIARWAWGVVRFLLVVWNWLMTTEARGGSGVAALLGLTGAPFVAGTFRYLSEEYERWEWLR